MMAQISIRIHLRFVKYRTVETFSNIEVERKPGKSYEAVEGVISDEACRLVQGEKMLEK